MAMSDMSGGFEWFELQVNCIPAIQVFGMFKKFLGSYW